MCMKLIIENVAKIKRAEVELNGITVIAGYNNTGKSTISKSLISIMNSFSDLDQKIRNEMKRGLLNKIDDWLSENVVNYHYETASYQKFESITNSVISEYMEITDIKLAFLQKLISSEFELDEEVTAEMNNIGELYEDIIKILKKRPNEYISFIVEREFRSIFNNQINTINSNETAKVTWINNLTQFKAEFLSNEINYFSEVTSKIGEPIYIETKTLLDDVDMRNGMRIRNISKNNILTLLSKTSDDYHFTIDEYQEHRDNTKTIKAILNETIDGYLVVNNLNYYFHDNTLESNVAIGNLASGLKNYVVIQTLIENGSLKRGRMLVIDEPEVNLHPEWQLKFAHILVLLQKEMGINILINTHSPYFLQAVEYYSKKVEIAGKTNFYSIDIVDGLGVCENVTNSMDIIYKKLAAPMIELQELEYEAEDGV